MKLTASFGLKFGPPLSPTNALPDRYASSPKHTGKSYLAVIDDFGPVPAEAKLTPELLEERDEPIDCLLVFYASLTERERAAVLFAARSFMARRNAALGQQHRLSNGVTLVEARLKPSEAREAGASFSTLRQITPDHVFFVPDAWRISSISTAVRVDPPRIDTAVAVIDTGISPTCAGLAGTVIASQPQLPPGAVGPAPDHGTFVASRIEYGDNLEQQLRTGVLKPLCPLVDVAVLGANSSGAMVPAHEGHIAAAIDRAIPSLPSTVRVVNAALGTDTPVNEGSISVVAQIMDKHASERDLLLVTTAGNVRDTNLLSGFPDTVLSPLYRLDSPGDSLLAITVGSIAKHVGDNTLSRQNELSAFSRRGPGPLGGVKPDIVAHGGNCNADGSTSVRVATHGLLPNGSAWAFDYGTSFAAPLVSAIAAELFDYYPGASANLIKALVLHFTKPVLHPAVAIRREHLVGLGEPILDSALRPTAHAATFLHAGELAPNTFTYLPFLVPDCLSPQGQGVLRVRATVVINPPVNPDNQLEYSKARVTLALRKRVGIGFSRVSISDDAVEGDKWWPLCQIDRTFHRSYSSGEWELQLRLWTRELPNTHRQKFGVVVEVLDAEGRADVYDQVAANAGTLYRLIHHRTAA